MSRETEVCADFKKYLKKLLYFIENNSTFKFANCRIVNKKRMDDIICCIEACWPEDYKKYVDSYYEKTLEKLNLKSYKLYAELSLAVVNRFFFSSSYYLVNYEIVAQIIPQLLASIEKDMNFIYSNEENMF